MIQQWPARFRTFLISILCLGFAQGLAAKQILPAPTKISPHVYVWIGPYEGPNKVNQGFRMNMAFVVGEHAVAVIDTGYSSSMAEEMLVYVRQVTTKPVKYAFNTNSQPHRFMGNDVFKQVGAELISHPLEAKRMQSMSGVFIGGIERALALPRDSVKFPAIPNKLIETATDYDLGGVRLSVVSHGQSHTPASLVIHVPEDNIVYAGDVLYGQRMLAILPDSGIKNWIDTFNKLKQYGKVTFIPGHGQPGTLQSFEFSTLAYLKMLYSHMTKAIDDGVDMDGSIKSLDQSKYAQLINYKQLAGRNASWAYLEAERASFE